jgi:ribonuclease-3
MPNKLGTLENLLGYKFHDIKLLERAVTHRSWAYEMMPNEPDEKVRELENESMEFLGDSVLGLAIAEELFRKNPKLHEGDLTLMKHRLVSTTTLGQLGEKMRLGDFLKVSRGEEKTGGRKKLQLLTNTLEAVIAAVFLDGGYVPARALILNIFAEELKEATPRSSMDFKTQLQELLQSRKLSAPTYSVVRTEGMPHDRTFFVEASWETGIATGSGNSIKSAEMMAASEALKMLNGDVIKAKR